MARIPPDRSPPVNATASAPAATAVIGNKSVALSGKQFYLPSTPSSACAKASPRQCATWTATHHLTQVVKYLPGLAASSFLPLQRIETTVLLIIAAGLGEVATWRPRRLLT